MQMRQLSSSLVLLPTEMNVDVVGHLVVTVEQAMDDLCSLQATCQEMCRVCKNTTIGRRVELE
jgi:hypothetical protein